MGFLRGLVTKNLSLKLASLALAVMLWMVVRIERIERQTLPGVPVRVTLEDTDWALAQQPVPPAVEVVFNGPTRELLRLSVERPVLNIPISEVHAGDTVIFLRQEWLVFTGQSLPVEDFQPSSVRLRFEPIRSRAVAVAPRAVGALESGLALAAPLATDPSTVRVRGPQGRVDALDSIRLQPLDLAGLTRSGAYEVAVDTTGLGSVEVGASRVSVIVQIEDQVRREILNVPVVPSGAGGSRDLSVSPEGVSVVLLGARSLVDAVEPAALRAVFPGEPALNLAMGDSVRLPVRVEGLPPLVRGVAALDSVTVRWLPPAPPEQANR